MPNYSGVWTLQEQYEAVLEGNWPDIFRAEFYSWGDGVSGRLGINSDVDQSSPIQIGSLTNWSEIGGSSAITNDNKLYVWGANSSGALGIGTSSGAESSPVQVGSLTNWSKISKGLNYRIAVKTDGTLWAWGDNSPSGKLGLGDVVDRSSPVQVGSGTNWADVFTYEDQSFAITTTGELYAWGDNTSGELGDNSRTFHSSPVQIGAGETWSSVGPGLAAVSAITTDGKLFSWGNNGSGELGLNLPNNNDRSSPIQVGALTNWAVLDGGNNFALAVKTDGTLWGWGNGGSGRIGDGAAPSIDRSSPVQVGADTDWSKVSAGDVHSLAIKTNGTLWSWGDNGNGELGQNSDPLLDRSSPVQVGSGNKWDDVVASNKSSFALFRIT